VRQLANVRFSGAGPALAMAVWTPTGPGEAPDHGPQAPQHPERGLPDDDIGANVVEFGEAALIHGVALR